MYSCTRPLLCATVRSTALQRIGLAGASVCGSGLGTSSKPLPLRLGTLAPTSRQTLIQSRDIHGQYRSYSSSTNGGKHQQHDHPPPPPPPKFQIPHIPIAVGLGVIAGIQFKHLLIDPDFDTATPGHQLPTGTRGVDVDGSLLAHILRMLPLRTLSRAWGVLNNDLVLPEWLRVPVLSTYAWIFNCQLHEMRQPDLKQYKNLGDFFYREIDLERFRPVDPSAQLVSPADGLLLHWGKVEAPLGEHDPEYAEHAIVHGIKGAGYNVQTLLGGGGSSSSSATTTAAGVGKELAAVDAHHARGESDLYYAVIYLAPGDYHRFHSPANWKVAERRHVHGELLSVSPRLLRRLPTLFTLNERVALVGQWGAEHKHNHLFAMVPVGATNVGSIRINFDAELATNHPGWYGGLGYGIDTRVYGNGKDGAVALTKGQEVGGFMLGSTVVLVFEAPKNGFKWAGKAREALDKGLPIKVKVGEALGEIIV
ncbi:phosphatidylserine decarboxylase-domain-containing protein [Catenaria anguillulae PL171]|uniref:phosphatidylserine decarboxylase n=1 Tax=Catenaria anguillulae PL171 TaxID=765915 RepID=A0A1Y2HYF4_9FUNG|nr:phosphatidylserine decarboxylase-domain-containing protein [Catenaria anguillulae PL171]